MAVLLFTSALISAAFLVSRMRAARSVLVTVERTRHREIDGLRGVLGIAVFIHHTVITWFFLHTGTWQSPPSRFVLHLGETAVALFFMITAFLFWGRVLARGRTIDWVEFLVSRLYRLYPTYLLMFGLVLVAVFLSTSPGQPASAPSLPKALLEWLAMFGTPDLNGFPDTGLLVAGVTWSLRYEWLFYLSLPLFGCLAARSRQPLAALLSALVVSAVIYRSSFHSPFDIEILQSFLGGIVAAYWIRRPGLVRAARTAVAGCTAAMALAIVVTLTPSARTWEATLGLTVFFVIVASGQSLGGLLRRPALLWLGDITYSIYLFHGFLLWLTFRHLIPPGSAIDGVEFIVISVVVAISLVLLCSAVFLTIEHPAISMGKRHFHWMTRSATALRTALSR